jgi:phosphoribosylglycinamide formyltransferase 1
VMARVLLLTSTARRHQFVANTLATRVELAGLGQEAKSYAPESQARDDEERRIIHAHLDARERSEASYFADHAMVRGPRGMVHRVVPAGGINAPAEIDAMAALEPDVLLVFGTGLLREPLIARFDGRIVNLHLGLSPYYRGSGTNFWPLVNREPEYVGATIHYLDAGIDSGPIIAHARPDVAAADGPHDLGNKTIAAAVPVLAAAAHALGAGPVPALPQTGEGRLYKRKDFTAAAVTRAYDNFRTGMIAEYLADRTRRDAGLELLRLGEADRRAPAR